MVFVDVLPWWERCTYWIIGLSSLAYSIYNVFLEEYKYNIEDALSLGWSWIGRKKDENDIEWSNWINQSSTKIPLLFVHVLISQICFYFKVNATMHSRVLLMYDLAALIAMLGAMGVVLQLLWAIIMYAVSISGSKPAVWVLTVVMIASIIVQDVYNFQLYHLKISTYRAENQFYSTSAFLFIRLTSFAIEKIKHKSSVADLVYEKKTIHNKDKDIEDQEQCFSICKTQENNLDVTNTTRKSDKSRICIKKAAHITDCDPSLLDLLFYAFYLPLFINGPIFIFNDFHSQVKKSFTSSNFGPDVHDIGKKLIRIAFWALFIEFQFHFLYFSALSLDRNLTSELSTWALAGIVICQCHFFMMKYLVIYGIPIQLSRFDGIISIAVPRCACWFFSFKDVWKYFDVGLYNFMRTYIYIPLGGSRAGWLRMIFSVFMTFMFLSYWHGGRTELFAWSSFNASMIILESIAATLGQSVYGKKLKSFVGLAVWLRIRCFLLSPVYMCLGLQCAYFCFNQEVAWVFISRLFIKVKWTALLIQFFVCNALMHNALYLDEWYRFKHQ